METNSGSSAMFGVQALDREDLRRRARPSSDAGELDGPHAAARDLGEGLELHRLGGGQGQPGHRARNRSRDAARAPHSVPIGRARRRRAPGRRRGLATARATGACQRPPGPGRRTERKASAGRWHAGCVVSKLPRAATPLSPEAARARRPLDARRTVRPTRRGPAGDRHVREEEPAAAAALRGGGRLRRRAAGPADPQRRAVPRRRRAVRRRPREVGRARRGRRQPARARSSRSSPSAIRRPTIPGADDLLPGRLRRARAQGAQAQLGQLLAHPPGPHAHPARRA